MKSKSIKVLQFNQSEAIRVRKVLTLLGTENAPKKIRENMLIACDGNNARITEQKLIIKKAKKTIKMHRLLKRAAKNTMKLHLLELEL